MKVLHTADWHLGKKLYKKERYDEMAHFISWLLDVLRNEKIDLLLIAGDVFDTASPSLKAQSMYYEFIKKAHLLCKHIVIIAGNHDSPTFFWASKGLITLTGNTFIFGIPSADFADEVFLLHDDDIPYAIVCAIPYLREQDLRLVSDYESIEDKDKLVTEKLKSIYQDAGKRAQALQDQCYSTHDIKPPIIAMGHLFAAGGTTVTGDGVRELYVGSLGHIPSSFFPDCFDYLALGHLHVPQILGGQEHLRYSGSPIAMGFGEVTQQKQVIIIDFELVDGALTKTIAVKKIPSSQLLKRLSGTSKEALKLELEQFDSEESVWLEINYQGNELGEQVVEELFNSVSAPIEILRIKTQMQTNGILDANEQVEDIAELDARKVFSHLLEKREDTQGLEAKLTQMYNQVLSELED